MLTSLIFNINRSESTTAKSVEDFLLYGQPDLMPDEEPTLQDLQRILGR
jgi:hypothetical protein